MKTYHVLRGTWRELVSSSPLCTSLLRANQVTTDAPVTQEQEK